MSGRNRRRRLVLAAAWVCVLAGVAGCAAVARPEAHQTASVVEFLYPDARGAAAPTGTPTLTLPLRVGIAFVPGSAAASQSLNEARRMEVMREVARRFAPYPFVQSIEAIPSEYLRPRGGFDNLDQLRALYGIDLVALVSYDQVQFTHRGLLSLTYWTIVGAYAIPGERNDTQTMIDTVVMDIGSRQMLFRAPGTSRVKRQSTFVNASEQLGADSADGFDGAARQMIDNLERELEAFRRRVDEHPDRYRIVRTPEFERRLGGTADTRVGAP